MPENSIYARTHLRIKKKYFYIWLIYNYHYNLMR